MNKVYEIAHNLGKSIKSSEEYKIYFKYHKEINKDKKIKELIRNYRSEVLNLQIKEMTGKKIDKRKLESIQNLENRILESTLINNYFESELKFTEMMNKIYKIINDYIDIEIEID